MFLPLLTTLLSLQSTLAAPVQVPSRPQLEDPYMCGYVLTEHNSSSYAGLPAMNWCAPIYYNTSLPGYQDAFAYRLFGGCKCGFFAEVQDCFEAVDPPLTEGPTVGESYSLFVDPKPKWFNCVQK